MRTALLDNLPVTAWCSGDHRARAASGAARGRDPRRQAGSGRIALRITGHLMDFFLDDEDDEVFDDEDFDAEERDEDDDPDSEEDEDEDEETWQVRVALTS